MIIGGLQKFSLLDYPGIVSAIIFTQGCNFRCHFCYNPVLVWPLKTVGKINNISSAPKADDRRDRPSGLPFRQIPEDDLFEFLQRRRGKLEGIVITGGEPTLHGDLPEFLKKIKDLGYLIKIDTNGTNPLMLEELLRGKVIDYIAMDLKGPKEKYSAIVGIEADFNKIEKSVKIIKESGLPHEFRTTIVTGLHEKNDVEEMGKIIAGAEKWFLQKFQPGADLVDRNFRTVKPYTDKEMAEMAEVGMKYVGRCETR